MVQLTLGQKIELAFDATDALAVAICHANTLQIQAALSMVGFLQGKVISKNPETNQCVVLAGDLGYEVNVSKRLFDALSHEQPISLWIHTHVREDAFLLYGFANETEKLFFRILLGVSGLGPKMALSLLTEHGARGCHSSSWPRKSMRSAKPLA